MRVGGACACSVTLHCCRRIGQFLFLQLLFIICFSQELKLVRDQKTTCTATKWLDPNRGFSSTMSPDARSGRRGYLMTALNESLVQ